MRKNESKPVLETARLFLREMTEADLDDLKEILQDEKVMTAYEGAFSEKEVRDWLARQQKRYRESSHKLGLPPTAAATAFMEMVQSGSPT